jgi:hypothetical protein
MRKAMCTHDLFGPSTKKSSVEKVESCFYSLFSTFL